MNERADLKPANRLRRNLALMGLACLFWILAEAPLQAKETGSHQPTLPNALGEIVYQSEAEAPRQLFIIANSHRSAVSGSNNDEALRAQVETFRIGEWLIRQQQVGLLLPEGFFGTRISPTPLPASTLQMNTESLERRLGDETQFVNAELLLHETYGVGLWQIEDRDLYHSTRNLLRSGAAHKIQNTPGFERQLIDLQRLRSTALLQNAPAVIDQAYQQGAMPTRSAILTIGLAHLDDFMALIRSKETVHPRPGTVQNPEPSTGITIIVPKSLMNNPLMLLNDYT